MHYYEYKVQCLIESMKSLVSGVDSKGNIKAGVLNTSLHEFPNVFCLCRS